MAKNLLKVLAGTVAEVAIVAGTVVVASGAATARQHAVAHGAVHGAKDILIKIERWKNKDDK